MATQSVSDDNYALREEALSLDNLLAKARSLEASETQATGMEKNLPQAPGELLNYVDAKKFRPQAPPSRFIPRKSNTCLNCGLEWPHRDGPCPARGHTCSHCGKPNHYARVCFSKQTPNNSRPKPQY